MSPLIFSFPQDYGYVTLAAASTGFLGRPIIAVFVGLFQTLAVGKARKAAKVPYPIAYVPHEEAIADPAKMKFNCAQRYVFGGNFIYPIHFACQHLRIAAVFPVQCISSLLFTGLRHPRFSASCGTLWVIGRLLYTMGYNTGDPSKRAWGAFHNFGSLGVSLARLYLGFPTNGDGNVLTSAP
ncbi:hypothetical protein VP01_329g10 [Puccinia sorghi]|uniref:Uncharacterized protein n=1 Tax=Puccinia sorghi TaxID=27349 RepID=A0A0L6UZE7_9BASI|nr:hypothetical protein VP01_329g10 [Puccinia sorghi]